MVQDLHSAGSRHFLFSAAERGNNAEVTYCFSSYKEHAYLQLSALNHEPHNILTKNIEPYEIYATLITIKQAIVSMLILQTGFKVANKQYPNRR